MLTIVPGRENMYFEEINILPIPLKFLSVEIFLDSIFPLCVNNYVKIWLNSRFKYNIQHLGFPGHNPIIKCFHCNCKDLRHNPRLHEEIISSHQYVVLNSSYPPDKTLINTLRFEQLTLLDENKKFSISSTLNQGHYLEEITMRVSTNHL